MGWINPYQSLKNMQRMQELESETVSLKTEIMKLKSEIWVHKDSALRTYDGLAIKADKYDIMLRVLEPKIEALEQFLNPKHVVEFIKETKEFINELKQA